jgi:MFS family permease
MSDAQISTLFILWSATSFLFEVPSGAWADTVDRRHLLVLSGIVYAGAFSSWLLWPTFAGFALGFVLWGVSGSLMSGTFESLLYDELSARGEEEDYAGLVGLTESAALAAQLLTSAAAVPLLYGGGYELVGWVSVALAGVHTVLAGTLPVSAAARRPNGGDAVARTERVLARYPAMLRAGIREAGGAVPVRRAVLIAAVLVGFTTYDEYFPLIAAEDGVPLEQVPVLVGLTVVGQAVGAALAGRTATLRPRTLGVIVLAGGLLISAGALTTPYIGFVGIAVGYGLLGNAMIVAEARLQEVISGPARATVTSVYGLATEVVAIGVYASFAGAAGLLSVTQLVALLGVPLAVVAWWVARRLPSPEPGPGGVEDSAPGDLRV